MREAAIIYGHLYSENTQKYLYNVYGHFTHKAKL